LPPRCDASLTEQVGPDVAFGPAIDQNVVWSNAAVAFVNDRTEALRLKRAAANFYVLGEIDAPAWYLPVRIIRPPNLVWRNYVQREIRSNSPGAGSKAIWLTKMMREEKTTKCGCAHWTLDLGSIPVWPLSACSPSREFAVRGKGGQNRIAYRS
jgi:hypothetical protein